MRLFEGGLDDAEKAELMQALQASPEYRREFDLLRRVHGDLEARGIAWRQSAPEVDLVDTVMGRVSEYRDFEVLLAKYTEDEATEDELARLHAATTANSGFAKEFEAARALKAELEHAARRGDTAAVDLVADVMEAVRATRTEAKVVPLRTRPKPEHAVTATRKTNWWLGAGLAAAAAAALAVGGYVVLKGALGTSQAPVRMARTNTTPGTTTVGQTTPDTAQQQTWPQFDLTPVPPAIVVDLGDGQASEEDGAATGWRAEIGLEEALAARQAAVRSETGAIGNLSKWASLTPDEARRLLADGTLSASDAIGLAEYLPPDEAAALLRDAIKQHPEDPFLRFSLAKHAADSTERLEQLAELARLDPQNALPYYMEAGTRFDTGDVNGAMAALADAQALEGAHPYSLNAARHRQEALEAAGMQPEVAEMLAAITAGAAEYNQVSTLATEMVSYGNALEAEGHYEAAEQVYQGVNTMGGQVADSAVLANEELAGLNAQLEANLALEGLYNLLNDPSSLEVVQWTYNQIAEGLEMVSQYLLDYNALFETADTDTASDIAGLIMEQGDTGLEHLFAPAQ